MKSEKQLKDEYEMRIHLQTCITDMQPIMRRDIEETRERIKLKRKIYK